MPQNLYGEGRFVEFLAELSRSPRHEGGGCMRAGAGLARDLLCLSQRTKVFSKNSNGGMMKRFTLIATAMDQGGRVYALVFEDGAE
jgi:hypothetical protein